MSAVHTRSPALTIRAGRRAFERLREQPFAAGDVHVIPGAAGGPKALGISGLDKAIFGDFLPRAPQERSLIGSSIGSWRFAAVASTDDPKAGPAGGPLHIPALRQRRQHGGSQPQECVVSGRTAGGP